MKALPTIIAYSFFFFFWSRTVSLWWKSQVKLFDVLILLIVSLSIFVT